jgi:hypothetical protein
MNEEKFYKSIHDLKNLGAAEVFFLREDGTKIISSVDFLNNHSINVLSTSLMHALQSLNSLLNINDEIVLETNSYIIMPLVNSKNKIFVLITYQKNLLTSEIKFKVKNYIQKISFTESQLTKNENLLFANLTTNEIEEVFKRIRVN